MTAEGPTLRTLSEAIEELHMCSSDMELPIESLIDVLQRIHRRRPHTSVSVGAIRHVIFDMQDHVIADATRWSEK